MTTDEFEAIPEDGWKALATTEITHLTDEEKDYLPRAWDEWIARVRRDAAREALDGLIADKAHMTVLLHAENGGNVEDVLTHYRDTHYPEESP